jgi:hypothetical protein
VLQSFARSTCAEVLDRGLYLVGAGRDRSVRRPRRYGIASCIFDREFLSWLLVVRSHCTIITTMITVPFHCVVLVTGQYRYSAYCTLALCSFLVWLAGSALASVAVMCEVKREPLGQHLVFQALYY